MIFVYKIQGGIALAYTQKGEWILADNVNTLSKNNIRTAAVHLKDPQPINYPVAGGSEQSSVPVLRGSKSTLLFMYASRHRSKALDLQCLVGA